MVVVSSLAHALRSWLWISPPPSPALYHSSSMCPKSCYSMSGLMTSLAGCGSAKQLSRIKAFLLDTVAVWSAPGVLIHLTVKKNIITVHSVNYVTGALELPDTCDNTWKSHPAVSFIFSPFLFFHMVARAWHERIFTAPPRSHKNNYVLSQSWKNDSHPIPE